MSDTLGNLGEMFPDQQVKCRVRGCNHTFEVSGEQAISNIARGKSVRAERMCDECYARLQTLRDKEMPCSSPGCTGTWIWNRYQQLEAYARNHGEEPKAPRGFCQECRSRQNEFQPKEMPCRIKSCKNTWTWTARDQFLAGGKAAPQRLCDECFRKFNELEDQTLPCRVKGCQGTVPWTRSQQLEYWRSGHSLEKKPVRMCSDCLKLFNSLQNETLPCKIKGCSGTWVYTAFEKLEQLRRTPEGEEPKTPQRMCRDCFEFLNNAKDIEQPCKHPGCTHTWVWSRNKQLSDHVRGIDEPRPRLCEECEKQYREAEEARARLRAEAAMQQDILCEQQQPEATSASDSAGEANIVVGQVE